MVRVKLVPLQASRALGSSKLQADEQPTVLFGTQVITGAVLSTSVTIWLQVALLEQQSVACQVRVISKEQPVPLVVVPTMPMVTLVPQQVSEAEGASKLQAEPHSTV